MEILIIRHGDAVEHAPGLGDGGRWLSAEGRVVTRNVAAWLAGRPAHRPVEIWTSPLVRAVQTAEIVASAAALDDDVIVVPALSTAGDPAQVAERLARHHAAGPLALVGHEPSLSSLAVALLGPVAWPGFRKSGVLGLSWTGQGRARFRFVLDPRDQSTITDVHRLGG